MPDWDADSSQLQKNLEIVLKAARDHARERKEPSIGQARIWHTGIMKGLHMSPPVRPSWVGHFRGETDQEEVHVRVQKRQGADPKQVAAELSLFEKRLREAVKYLDDRIPPGILPDTENLELALRLMSWVHGEWVRIHPFANGNGRVARLWANWVAMRYGIPPFVRLRPRPQGDAYANAAAEAMESNYEAMIPVFRIMLQEFLNEKG